MKAVIYDRYGPPDVMQVADLDQPEPGENGILIRVVATSLNRSDWEMLTGSPIVARMAGLRAPRERILGSDVAGTVTAVGEAVTGFQPGDEVFGDIIYNGKGALAEYVAVSDRAPLAVKPADLDFELAASLPQSAVLALEGLRARGGTNPGDEVLINGAGGGGGTFAIQLAKSHGAVVTGVDNGEKLETMKAAGADHVLDYRTEKYTRTGVRYDRILDFVGNRSLFANRRALKSDGVYLVVGGPLRRILMAAAGGWLISKLGRRSLGLLIARPNADDLDTVARLVADGTLRPMIDRVYPLEGAPDAMRRLGEGHALGKLIIRVGDQPS